MMASRVTLDSQGRLILRENGKIILPFEHFANAVMLKHMNGPHGLHLGVEATVRAVSVYSFFRMCSEIVFLGNGIIYNWTRFIWNGKGVYYRSCSKLSESCMPLLQEPNGINTEDTSAFSNTNILKRITRKCT